jgi:hypothetical protein
MSLYFKKNILEKEDRKVVFEQSKARNRIVN